MKSVYLTTPLYYVNAKPHIGHAYTNVLCDTFARYKRFRGEPVFFLTGTDEHGTKIEKMAREQGMAPKEFVDGMVPHFQALWKRLGIQYDYFIRTTDADHQAAVQSILKDLEKRGEIYKAGYTGWYCTPCESFWTKLQLSEGLCPDCRREVQEIREENYFFKLSAYQSWLIQYIGEHPDFIRPEMRKNEILGFLKEPLEDLCITRPRSRLLWGIDFPTSREHVVYVWFDALINYVSAAGHPADPNQFTSRWPADLHLVGKDILRQHAVYWPIMLKAMGLELPRTIVAHGWWTLAGAKVSKSKGNAVDPLELVNKYGVDALRFFLLHEVTVGMDGAFSEDLLAERYTTQLANDLGNLWFRVASMLDKYWGGKLPPVGESALHHRLLQDTFQLLPKVCCAMDQYDPRGALDIIWEVVTRANQFVEERKPWVLGKSPEKKDELAETLYVLTECVAHTAFLLQFLLPDTAQAILNRLHVSPDLKACTLPDFSRPFVPLDQTIERGAVLFPRLDDPSEKK